MKKTTKKLLSIILAMLMVITTIPTFAITAFAEQADPVKSLDFNVNYDGFASITEDFTYMDVLKLVKDNFSYIIEGQGEKTGDELAGISFFFNGKPTEYYFNGIGEYNETEQPKLFQKIDMTTELKIEYLVFYQTELNNPFYGMFTTPQTFDKANFPITLNGKNIDYGIYGDWTSALAGKEDVTAEIYDEDTYFYIPLGSIQNMVNNAKPKAPTWNTTKVSTQLTAGIRLIEHKDAKDAKISWGKVADADGYIIYANYCGSKEKAIKTVTNNKTTSYSFKKLNGKALDLTKPIKVYVAAYKNVDGKKVQMGRSLVVHHSGVNNKKYTVVKTVNLNKNAVTITQGKTFAVKATVNKASAKKALQTEGHSKYYRYISSNPSVATVNANGVITAKKAGKCTIYVVTQNGSKAKLAVTVK